MPVIMLNPGAAQQDALHAIAEGPQNAHAVINKVRDAEGLDNRPFVDAARDEENMTEAPEESCLL